MPHQEDELYKVGDIVANFSNEAVTIIQIIDDPPRIVKRSAT